MPGVTPEFLGMQDALVSLSGCTMHAESRRQRSNRGRQRLEPRVPIRASISAVIPVFRRLHDALCIDCHCIVHDNLSNSGVVAA